MKKFSLILFLTFLSMGFFNLPRAQAIEYEMLGGKPANPDPNVKNSESWFIYNLAPGQAKEDAVEVMNLFPNSWEALVYAADTTKSSSGGFALKQFSEEKQEVGSWVKFYPDAPPAFFQKIFKDLDSKILALCGMSQADLALKMNQKNLAENDLNDLKNWCDGKDSVKMELKTKERITIPFIIRVPEGTEVGEHTGGVLIQKVMPDVQDSGNGSSIKLTTRVGVRIYETVPGEVVRKLVLADFQVIKNFKEFSLADLFGKPKKAQEYIIQTTSKNDGNISLDQQETIHIKDLLFKKGNADIPRNFQVLKQDSFISNYSWNNPRFGHFSFSTEIKYQDSEGKDVVLTSKEIKLWIIPWREITVTLIIFAVIFAVYLLWKLVQKKKYGGAGWVKYEIAPGENIDSLAEKFKIDWKILAKTNKMKPPYILQPGQAILAPKIKSESNTEEAPINSVPSSVPVDPLDKSLAEKLKAAEMRLAAEHKTETTQKTAKSGIKKEIIKPVAVLELEKTDETPHKIKEEIVKKEDLMVQIPPVEKTADKSAALEKLFSSKNEAAEPVETEKELSGKSANYKKIIFVIIGVIILAGIVLAGVIFFKNRKKNNMQYQLDLANTVSENQQENQDKENLPAPTEEKKPEKPVVVDAKPADINILVLNEGALPGSAGKIKNFLVGKGYPKTEAKNGVAAEIKGSFVFYKDESFQKEATWIAGMLAGKDIKAELKMAESEEEKSADIVIILGK